MDPFFQALGKSILEHWQDANFALEAFPAIAVRALEERPPAKHVKKEDFMRHVLLNDEHPLQSHSTFGQPEIIVFDHPRFYIQVLFWMDGTTDIHQHTFSGAFHVMDGSSIHSIFKFENRIELTEHFHLGDLQMSKTELLEKGQTREIRSGRSFIHSLFHLETPSVTVVVRTHCDPGQTPQFTYLAPRVALDPLHADALTERRKQLLDILSVLDEESYVATVVEMLGKLDLESGFFILQNCAGTLGQLGHWPRALTAFKKRHGKLAEGIAETIEHIILRDQLVALRFTTHPPEHRFFMALLLNLPNRDAILKMVSERFPGDPAQRILDWCEELTEFGDEETMLLDCHFPPEIEVDLDEEAPLMLQALEHFLKPPASSALKGKKRSALDPQALEELRGSFENSSLRALLK